MPLVTETGAAYGERLVLVGLWRDEYAEEVSRHRRFELNTAKGSQFEDLDVLETIPSLELLIVVNLRLRSSAGLQHMDEQLRTLVLSSYDTIPVDFSRWPNLTTCSFDWRKRSESLYSCASLKRLHINRPALRSMTELRELRGLERLTLTSARRLADLALDGLTSLEDLRVTLANRVTSLDGIQGATALTRLELDTCRGIQSLDPIAELPNLRVLSVINGGAIDSLAPLAGHPSLEEFHFYETTNIVDGNISVLKTLPRLRKVSFQNRKHYDVRNEDLPGFE